MKRVNFKGQRFGKLVVFREHKMGKDWYVVCRCDCGLYVAYLKRFVQRRRPVKDCRHCHLNKTGKPKFGRVASMPISMMPEYKAWMVMIQRCTDENHPSYKDYGGRGIMIADNWLIKDGANPPTGFRWFFHEVGYKPSPEHTLDRIDVNGHYQPGNVRWATPVEQRANQRQRGKVDGQG